MSTRHLRSVPRKARSPRLAHTLGFKAPSTALASLAALLCRLSRGPRCRESQVAKAWSCCSGLSRRSEDTDQFSNPKLPGTTTLPGRSWSVDASDSGAPCGQMLHTHRGQNQRQDTKVLEGGHTHRAAGLSPHLPSLPCSPETAAAGSCGNAPGQGARGWVQAASAELSLPEQELLP